MPVIAALGRLRQEQLEFEVDLGYIAKTLSPAKQQNKHQIQLDLLIM